MDAGWYPDAQDPGTQRYWDGSSWTDHTTGAASSGAASSSGPSPTWWEDDATARRSDALGAVEPGAFAPPAPATASPNPFASFDSPAAPAPAVIPAAGPPPGWMADPQVPGGQRYWDGAQWTEHRTPPANPYGQAGPATPVYTAPGYGAPGYGYAGPAVSPKSPALSLIVSFFIPGVGSMINGDVGKGVGILIGYIIAWVFTFILIGLPFLFGFWIWGLVDGYQGAVKWNARHGIIS